MQYLENCEEKYVTKASLIKGGLFDMVFCKSIFGTEISIFLKQYQYELSKYWYGFVFYNDYFLLWKKAEWILFLGCWRIAEIEQAKK